MGNKKLKNKSRSKFNKAPGKHSWHAKNVNRKAMYRKERKVEQYAKDKIKCRPYQIVREQAIVNGMPSMKFSVRRIPIIRNKKTHFLKLKNTSIAFKIKSNSEDLTGNRIINLENLKQHVVEITLHTAQCEKAQDLVKKGQSCVVLQTETRKQGFYSVLNASCKGCSKRFTFETSKMNTYTKIADINLRAVWGTIATGGGCSPMNELFGTMNIPSLNRNQFSRIENQIGKWWDSIFKEEILKAGMEERRLAIERNDFHQGVPYITVICDGGWSKRSHKHTYNASGGVAVIFGAQTKKLLYIGVRNKYCYLCDNGKHNQEHVCYKNWTESSQSMESDMIIEGFMEAESLHGLRYLKIIADGDSSVYSRIVQEIPVWGPYVQKVECANHACKCLRASLERLVDQKPEYKGKGKLTKAIRVRLTTAVRCAIKMRSEEKDAKLLKKDIKNSVYHIFGFHENCSNFCKKNPNFTEETESNEENVTENHDEISDDIQEIFTNQSNFWYMGTNAEMEESRYATLQTTADIKNIIRDVSVLLNRLAEKSSRLIGNFTTNIAESWMNIRSKFDGGKIINRCNRGSWNTRCIGGALRKNLGPAWSPVVYQRVSNEQPGKYFLETFRRKSKHLITSLKSQKQEKHVIQRRKRKQKSMTRPSKKAKLDYGPDVLSDMKDITREKLDTVCCDFLKKVIEKKTDDIKKIEKTTKQQHLSKEWINQRKIRLTSSNFGKIYKRKINNVSTSFIKNTLYTNFKGNLFTVRGLTQESNTLTEYKNKKAEVKEIQKMGLMIYEEKPFLAASTDGRVIEKNGDVGLIEVKNILQNNKLSFIEASKSVPNFCLKLEQNGKLSLNKKHDYYYQCQGQINIFGYNWVDFVVRRTEPYQMHIERIYRDSELWKSMLPKLEAFYMKFLLPELAVPRYGTVSGIRQPESPWYEDKQEAEKQPVKSQSRSKKRTRTKVQRIEKTDSDKPDIHRKERLTAIHAQPSTSNEDTNINKRQRRTVSTKFVGRRISHKWCTNEDRKQEKWFKGVVLDVKTGKDGSATAIYEVQYDGEKTTYDLKDLHLDYNSGNLMFIDV